MIHLFRSIIIFTVVKRQQKVAQLLRLGLSRSSEGKTIVLVLVLWTKCRISIKNLKFGISYWLSQQLPEKVTKFAMLKNCRWKVWRMGVFNALFAELAQLTSSQHSAWAENASSLTAEESLRSERSKWRAEGGRMSWGLVWKFLIFLFIV